jgi:peptidoglycan/xylan/chitin deacetylase (PgdA/CDA1 family)
VPNRWAVRLIAHSLEEAIALVRGELVEIGARTVTLADLPMHPAASQREEIRDSKTPMEEVLGRAVTGFSYPHGDLSPETAAIVREVGFACACSTHVGVVRRLTDP